MISKNKIYAIDAALIIGSLVVLMAFMRFSQPHLIAPLNNEVNYGSSVLFSFSNADTIYIDDNPEFSSPEEIHVRDNIIVNLVPGNYYWKTKGIKESEIRQLTIASNIDLRLREANGTYDVVNAGNTPLDVQTYDKGKLIANVTLGIDRSTNASGEEINFVGRQNG